MGKATRSPNFATQQSIGGLDLLRLAAVLMVSMHHALRLVGQDDWTIWRSLSIGQLGVAIFLGISALLSCTSRRTPAAWLSQRLRRIYPAYWITMIFSFTLVWISGYKDFTAGQFLSQMLGAGLFTHSAAIVNVPTWFVSLILLCYLAQFFHKLSGRPLLCDLLWVVAICVWGGAIGFEWPWFHLLTFFAVAALTRAIPTSRRAAGFLVTGALLVLLASAWQDTAYAYTGITMFLIGAALGLARVPRFIEKMSEYSYEYYLLHGIFLVAVISALPGHPAFAIAGGIGMAACSAILLRAVASATTKWLAARLGNRRFTS